MRVYISVDMEGVAGVVHEDQTNPTDPRCAPEYARFRKLMTAEANAALATEAHDLLGDEAATVIVKEAVGRHAARSLAPAVACRRIREAVTKALKRRRTKPFVVEAPI